MWEMYDRLIAEIPEDLVVDEYIPGRHFSFLRSGELCGVAHFTRGASRPAAFPDGPAGQPLKKVAAQAKSWNMEEATMGMAAINAWDNQQSRLEASGIFVADRKDVSIEERKKKNPMNDPGQLRGKKVALIGHFRNVEQKLEGLTDLYILERKPGEGDYPDSACEYLLPEMDVIYSTGMTLINKTLKRLLELKAKDAQFTLMGPTSTLSPVLFDYGVDHIASFVVTDPDLVRDVISKDCGGMFAGGVMVDLTREDFGGRRK